jgi:hypothetical protein
VLNSMITSSPIYRKSLICRCSKCQKIKVYLEMATTWYGGGTCKKCVEELYLKIDAKLRKAFKK